MNKLNKDLKNITFRKEQTEAMDFIFDTIENDPNKRNILLDLPTGVGKSILGLSFCQRYLKDVNSSAKFDFITNSKMLQQQYFEEFNSPSNLWGKNNYTCDKYNCACETGKELNRVNKSNCEYCPYDRAKNSYLFDDVNLTNFHLFVMLHMYQEEYMNQRKSNVLIVDECHNFEKIFSDFIAINLSEGGIKKLGLKNYKSIFKSIGNVKSMDMFIEFCEEFLLNEIADRINEIKSELKSDGVAGYKMRERQKKMKDVINDTSHSSVSNMRILGELESYVSKIKHFITDYAKIPENWVMETTYNNNKNREIKIQPVWAHPYLEKHIWSKYDHVIMMSGTILDKDLFSYINGLSVHQTEYYSIDSPFDVKNRPIYYMPIGKMTYTKKQDTFKKYVPFLEKIMKKYKSDKGVIHSHTYELSKWVKNNVENDRFIFHDYKDKDRALKIHYNGDDPSVLCSPSISTGVDLENERARFQVMLKVPYPSLASKKNKMRQSTMPEYYAWETVAGIIQMYGRAVRSYNDYADFIILDGSFGDVMRYSSRFIPNWVMKAIKRVDSKKATKGKS